MKLTLILIVILTYILETFLSVLNYHNKDKEIPEEVKDIYDETAYKKWLRYNMENFRLGIISGTVSTLLILSLLIFNVLAKIFTVITDITDSVHIQALLLLGFYFTVDYLIGIFFSYHRQFNIEERYGFNKTTLKTFIIDKIKGLFLFIIIGGNIIFLLSNLYHDYGNRFYLYAWIFLIVLIILVNLTFGKVFILIFNKIKPLEEGELKDKIVSFAGEVGYEVKKIKVMDASRRTTKLNAYFMGLGKFKQVILFDTLIAKMNTEQIISVLAHEIGHCKQKHIIINLLITIANISLYLFVLWLCVSQKVINTVFGFNETNFGFGVLIFIFLTPAIAFILEIIINPLSRKFEYQADSFAAVNGYKEEMIEALKILGRENFVNLTPHPLYVAIKYSHPPISLRIKALEKIR